MFANDRPRRALSPRPAQHTTAHPRTWDGLQPRRLRFVRAARRQSSVRGSRSIRAPKRRRACRSIGGRSSAAVRPRPYGGVFNPARRRGVSAARAGRFSVGCGGVQLRSRLARPCCLRASRVLSVRIDVPLRSPRATHRCGVRQLAPDDLSHVEPPRLPRSVADGRTEARAPK
jgi:hypothetical protein